MSCLSIEIFAQPFRIRGVIFFTAHQARSRIIMLSSKKFHFRKTLNTCFASNRENILLITFISQESRDRMCHSDEAVQNLNWKINWDWTREPGQWWEIWIERSRWWFDLFPSDQSWLTSEIFTRFSSNQIRFVASDGDNLIKLRHLRSRVEKFPSSTWAWTSLALINDSNFLFSSSAGSSNGISPLLFNAGLVSHYRRYLNPVDPRMFITNGNVTELNKSNCKGRQSDCE